MKEAREALRAAIEVALPGAREVHRCDMRPAFLVHITSTVPTGTDPANALAARSAGEIVRRYLA